MYFVGLSLASASKPQVTPELPRSQGASEYSMLILPYALYNGPRHISPHTILLGLDSTTSACNICIVLLGRPPDNPKDVRNVGVTIRLRTVSETVHKFMLILECRSDYLIGAFLSYACLGTYKVHSRYIITANFINWSCWVTPIKAKTKRSAGFPWTTSRVYSRGLAHLDVKRP